MSGHSKFANIKHKKEKNDAAKGNVPSAKPKYVIWNNSWNVNGWLEKP